MAPWTPYLELPYPPGSTSPDVPLWMQQLAERVEALLHLDWTPVTVNPEFSVTEAVEVARVGEVVYWRGSVSRSLTADEDIALVGTGGVPEEFRPESDRATRSVLATIGSQYVRAWVTVDGAVMIRTDSQGGQTIYLKGLSGYGVIGL